ncbi:MAG: hypothetical protein A2Y24_01340 [Clostridiales bacterium GWE2_32_10]|nr:MAG: hypothetical protein A2Y24_01340 [Clostridiales bacterium GWE2_32_10]
MLCRKILFVLTIIMMLNFIFVGMVDAEAQINDVKTSNFAYGSISKLINQGIMSIDTKGNFYPEQSVNRFDLSRFVAKILGYDEIILSSAKEGKQTEIKITNKYKNLIDLYEKKFKDWDKNSNMQIAFLLEKGILKELDLAKFVIEYPTGEQSIKVITKQEMAIWIVRIIGKETVASTYKTDFKFADDSQIDDKSKEYVYYLKSIGIFNGDEKNKFNPRTVLRKDILAVLLDRIIETKNNNSQTVTTTPILSTTPTTVPTGVDNKVKLYSGEIETLYDDNYAVKIKQSGGVSKIVNLSENAVVVNQNEKTHIKDMKQGNIVICVEKGSYIEKLYVTTITDINSTYYTLKQELTTQGIEIVEDTVVLNTNMNGESYEVLGTLKQILIADENEVIIEDSNRKKTLYRLRSSSEITLENKKCTIYDLRLGQKVEATISGVNVSKLMIISSE